MRWRCRKLKETLDKVAEAEAAGGAGEKKREEGEAGEKKSEVGAEKKGDEAV